MMFRTPLGVFSIGLAVVASLAYLQYDEGDHAVVPAIVVCVVGSLLLGALAWRQERGRQ